MSDDYIHLKDFEKFVRNRFKNIVKGERSVVPRAAVRVALDDIFKDDDAVLTNAMHSDGKSRCEDCGQEKEFCRCHIPQDLEQHFSRL